MIKIVKSIPLCTMPFSCQYKSLIDSFIDKEIHSLFTNGYYLPLKYDVHGPLMTLFESI